MNFTLKSLQTNRSLQIKNYFQFLHNIFESGGLALRLLILNGMNYNLVRAVSVFLLVITLGACEEPDGIGLEVLPDGEEMPIAWVDTFSVEARTVLYDSVPTSGLSSYLIGDFGDPIFGRVRSELFTQYQLGTTDIDFGSSPQIDSVVLNLAYSGAYGATDKFKGTMTFGVYELIDDLYSTAAGDSVYYSTSSPQVSATGLAELQFRPDLYADVVSGEDTLPPSLRIPLDQSFGQRILDSDKLASNEVFLEDFKGLNVKPTDAMMPSGFGSILYFNMASSFTRLEVYYHNDDDDSLRINLDIQNSFGIHTAFNHEFPASILAAVADSTVAGADNLYIQSMAGLRMKIELPHLRTLSELGAVAINKAELVVPVDESVVTEYGLPLSLQVTAIGEDGGPNFIDDFFEGADYYGGRYDSENGEYVFNVARHLQSLLSAPEEPDYGLFITNSGNAVHARRGVFNGTEHPDRPLKLRMTYTIIE